MYPNAGVHPTMATQGRACGCKKQRVKEDRRRHSPVQPLYLGDLVLMQIELLETR